ncbi:retrovirus-related Pol polyprotein from transposon 17.6 [Trichonephila clavipes]|uniref:Retrovirus-related Pol polyprotein from transposon 17.6 n=1 Tax=Trichonephila clavipes TaxID=2585209 RepID=A0A8X6W6R7_TRICX|nr:retrovirus-related Pol polyprotein from transposon 17.6 [Trichonephila clavipes]
MLSKQGLKSKRLEKRGVDSGDAMKGEDEVIIVSSDAEDEILILALQEYVVAAVAEWYRYRTVACFVTGSSPVPLKTRRCQRAGKPNDKKKAPLKLVPVIQEVFTKLNIDACGPLPIPSKGNRYLITAICMSSKFPEAIPVSDISSCSDYSFFERFGILVRHSSVYHPQSNPVERFHRTLKRLLRVLCLDAGSEWDKHLPSILLALRTVSHESTGYTPSELVYGKNLRTPETLVMEHWMEPEEESDLVTEYMFKLINRFKRCQEVAINKIEEMQVKRKTWYDKNAVKREFKVTEHL